MWVSSLTRFIPEQIYDLGNEPINIESLKGRDCYGGLDEDALIESLLCAAERLCVDVSRLSDEKWEAVKTDTEDASLIPLRETMNTAILYTLGYFFEHREEADHHGLTLTLRSILFAIREGVV